MIEQSAFARTLGTLRDSLRVEIRRFYDELVKRLRDADVLENAMKAGDKFPHFALPNGRGQFVHSSDLLARGPLVVTFYRGQWCPFCSATVEAMVAETPAMVATGATVIGITPEIGESSLCAQRRHELNFEMLCDLDNGLALECGVLFRLTDDVIRAYLDRGFDLSEVYGNGSYFLPVPASYVIRRDGTIAHAFMDADFRYRVDPKELVIALASLNDRDPAVPPPNRAFGPA